MSRTFTVDSEYAILLCMILENIPIEKIIPYERNPRKNDNAVSGVIASIESIGYRTPIIVDENMVILVGHTRLKALQKMGWKTIPFVVQYSDLTIEQKNKYRILDNKTSEVAEWDFDILLEDFGKEQLLDFGFEDKELINENMLIEDKIPETPSQPKTKYGDIYELGNHRVMCGDSTIITDVEKLMDGKKADMVFTDPPYGISFEDNKGNAIKNDSLNDEKMREFNKLWQESANIVTKGDCFLLAWQSPRKFHLLDYYGSWVFFRLITMYKSNRISFPHGAWINKTEPCCIFSKGEPRITKQKYTDDCYVYKHDKESHEDSNVGHPTPKPVKMVIENITACIKQDDIALDLFLGSGSTLIACEQTNRICYGMELDEKYCDMIVQRWVNLTGGKVILNGAEIEWPLAMV